MIKKGGTIYSQFSTTIC